MSADHEHRVYITALCTCSHILTKSYRKLILQNEWTVHLVRIRFRCVLKKFSDKTIIILLRSIGRNN